MKVKKSIIILLCAFLLSLCMGINASAQTQIKTNAPDYGSRTTMRKDSSLMRADVIKLMKRVINGKVYIRYYNTTTGEWIGEWELLN